MKIIITVATADINDRVRSVIRAISVQGAGLTATSDPDRGVKVWDVEIQGAPDEIAQYLGL